MSDNIHVAIRLRPLNERELKNEKSIAWKTPDNKTILPVDSKAADQKYIFDRVYDSQESTIDIYEETVRDIVLAGIEGFNGTIFAYGQTSSGKTFTMSGTKLQMGIIPLAIESIFDTINVSPGREFLLRVSYMEIYNEKITDLLDAEEKTMKMLEDENRQIIVSGLHEEVIRSPANLIQLKKRGDTRRRVAETARNEESSRSHAIFQIIIESQERQFNEEDLVDESVRLSSLYFVDLAGSEKASENSGERFREGCAINKSLMTLAQVISKLSDGVSNQYINYRDSKLTRLLQNGLGGNSKTAIICTVNPTAVEETNSTLRFASRAKIIKNKPTINELTDTSDKAILKRYQKEIADLHRQIEDFKKQTPRRSLNPYCDNDVLEQEKSEVEKKYQNVISKLKSMLCVSTSSPVKKKLVRRETWCPGVLKRKLEQAGHLPALPALAAVGTPSRILGNILEEKPSPEKFEKAVPEKKPRLPRPPLFFAHTACQTDRMEDSDKITLLKLETEMLRNQNTLMSAELNDLKSRPAKQRRVSFESHDETKEFLELELEFAQEGKNNIIEEEKKLEQDRRKFKEERIKHDEAVRNFQAEKKQLTQRVEAKEEENSCLLKNLENSQERVKKLENELNNLQNLFNTTTGGNSRRSIDRPLLNMSNITDRSKRGSRGDSDALKQEVASLQAEMEMQETEILKLTRDLEKCKEQLKNKCEEIRFLSMETNDQKEKLEVLELDNGKLMQTLEDKTPVSELPEVVELKTRLSEVSQEKNSLQQKLKTKSEELTYLSRQSAVYLEQMESKNISPSAENGEAPEESKTLKTELSKTFEEVASLKTELSTMKTERSEALRDLNINKMYCNNLKDQLKVKTDECSMLQKNLDATHEEVVAMREALVGIKDQLLAKEELILELSQVRLADVSSQQSMLLGPDQETIDSLQDQLNAKSKECESLTEQLKGKNMSKSGDEVNVGVEDQTNSLNQDQETIESLQDQLNAKSKECESLTERLQDLERKNSSKSQDNVSIGTKDQNEKQDQSEEISTAQQEKVVLEEKYKQLMEERDAMELLVAQQSEDLSTAQQEKVVLEEKYKQLMEERDAMELLIAQQAEELSTAQQLLAEREKCLGEVESEMKAQLNDLKATCKVKEDECISLNEQLSQIQQECDKLTSATNSNGEKQASLEAEAETQSAEIAKLKEQLSIAEKDHEVKVKDCFELNEQISNLTEKLSQNSEKQHQLERELEAQSQKCSELTESLRLSQESEQSKNVDEAAVDDDEDEIILQTPARAAEITLLDSLREELDATREECSRLKGVTDTQENHELKTLKLENGNLMSACSSLREQMTQLKEDQKQKAELMDSLRKEFEDKSQDHKILIDEMKTLKMENENKMSACTNLSEKISTLRQEKAASEEILESLRAEFSATEEELYSLKKELEDSKRNGNSKCNKCENLAEQLCILKDQTAQEVAALENKMSLMRSEQESDSLKQGPVTSNDESKSIETPVEIDSEMTDKDSMQKSVDLLKEELRVKSEECTNLSTQLQEMTERNISQVSTAPTEDNNEELSLCKHQLEDKIEECHRLKEELENLQDDYQILKMSLDDLGESSQLADPTLQNQLSKCQAELVSKTQECTSLNEKLSEMEKAISCKNEEFDTLNKMSTLEEALHSKTEECSALNEKISSLEEKHGSLQNQLSECQANLESKTQEYTSLNEKLSEMEKDICSKSDECNSLHEKMSSLEELLSLKTEECQSLTEKLAVPNAVETVEANSSQQIVADSKDDKSTEVHKELEQLRELCNLKTSECENLSKQEIELKKNFEHIEGSLAEEMLKKVSLMKELQTAKSDIEMLREELEQQSQRSQNFFLDPPATSDDDKLALSAELEAKTQKCASLSEEMENLKQKIEDLKTEKEKETKTLRSSLEEFQAKSLDYDVLVEEINRSSSESEKKELREEIQNKSNELEVIREENARLASVVEQEQQNLEVLQGEFDENLQELESMRQECSSLKEDLTEMNCKANTLQESLRCAQEQEQQTAKELGVKSLECEQITKDLCNVQKECESLKMSLLSLDEENNQLSSIQKDLHTAQSNLDAKIVECSVMSQHIETLSAEIESLKVSLLNLNDENQELLASKDKVVSLQGELDDKSQDHAKLLEEVADLKEQKQNAQDLIAMKETEILAVQNELGSKLADVAELKEQFAHLTKKNGEIEMENVSLRESLIKLDEQNDKLSTLNDCLVIKEKELVSKSEECAVLSAELEAAKTSRSTTLTEIESKLESKTQECLNLTEEMAALKEQATSVEDRFSQELESKCEESALLSSELMTEKQNKIKMLEEMKQELSAKSEECISLSKQVADLQKEHGDAVTGLEKELADKSEQCNSLSAQLADLLKKHSELEQLLDSKKSSDLEEQLKSLVEECDALKEKLQAEEEKVKSVEAELDAKNKSLEYKEGVCKFLYESNTSIKNEMDQIKEQINNSSLQKMEGSMTSALPSDELTQQLKKAQEEKASNKTLIKKLKREIIELKDKMEEIQGKADLCETVLEENKDYVCQIETLSSETTLKSELIAKLKMQDPSLETNESNEGPSSLQNQLQEKMKECRDLSEQLKTVQADLMEAKSQLKKLKIEKIRLQENFEDIEGKANLCEVYQNENKEKELKLKELEDENLETTMRLTKLEAELEKKPDLSMMSMNQTEDLSELTLQLKKALEEKDSHKSVAKKLKIEKIKLTGQVDELESKADLYQVVLEENKSYISQIESLSAENTKKNELIAKLEMQDPSLTTDDRLIRLQNQLQEKTQELSDLTNQLITVQADLAAAKAQSKKLKIDKIQLDSTLEDLEGKANLYEVLQEEIKNHLNKIETLSSENTEKDEKINKLEIDVHEKQECIRMLETKTFCDLKGQELENLQRQLSKKTMHLVWAESDYIKEKSQYEKKMNSYEETINILNDKIKYLKEELRLLHAEKDETTVKVPRIERKRTRSAYQAEAEAVQSQGFLDHMAFITLEAENAKLTRKIESLKQKLGNAFKNHEELKKELQTFKETAEKENTPSKRKKVAEKSTNTEILKLSETNTPTRTPTRTPRGKRAERNTTPSRLQPQQREQSSTVKNESTRTSTRTPRGKHTEQNTPTRLQTQHREQSSTVRNECKNQ